MARVATKKTESTSHLIISEDDVKFNDDRIDAILKIEQRIRQCQEDLLVECADGIFTKRSILPICEDIETYKRIISCLKVGMNNE